MPVHECHVCLYRSGQANPDRGWWCAKLQKYVRSDQGIKCESWLFRYSQPETTGTEARWPEEEK